MTTATMTRTTKKRISKAAESLLPPSAGVTNVAGQDLLIMPLNDFEEWLEDIALSALVEERLKDDGAYISRDELDARLAKRDKRRAKQHRLTHVLLNHYKYQEYFQEFRAFFIAT